MTDLRVKNVSLALFIAGGCSISGQVILLRELMASFQGNELSIGAILAVWLLWGALGSWAAGLLSDRVAHPVSLFVVGLFSAAVLLPATVFASGLVRVLAGSSPVEMIGFFPFLWSAGLMLGPLCFVQGGFFALGSKVLSMAGGEAGVSWAYLLESAGAGAGGLVLSLLLIDRLPPVDLALLLSAAMVLCAVLLVRQIASARGRLQVVIVVVVVVLAAGIGTTWLDAQRYRMMWQPMRLLEAANSLHGNLAAVDIAGEVSLYEDGLLAATSGSRLQAEELVHLGLAQHPGPRRVLLIGGGLSGCLHEILKHPVERVDYVELDPQIIALGRKYLSPDDVQPLADPRVRVHNIDARYFVKHSRDTYDAVLMDLPGPRSARLNRMYSLEFFGELKAVLSPGGIAAFAIAGSEVYASPEQRLLLASLSKTARRLFRTCLVLPGETCLFVLSDAPLQQAGAAAVLDRLDTLGIQTVYVGRDTLPYQLTPQKQKTLAQAIEGAWSFANVNNDFQPVGYLYDLAEWSAHFRGERLQHIVWAVIGADHAWLYVLPAGLLLLLGVGLSVAGRSAVGLAVAVGGLSEMIFQLVALIGFQVLYGYLFYRMGLMVGAFMGGLAIGSLLVWRLGELSNYSANRHFLLVQAGMCLYPLALPLVLQAGSPGGLLMLLPVLAGVIGGMQLPLSVQMLRKSRRGLGRSAGWLYGLDLLGSCVGALIAGPILIPTLGLIGICLWAALLNMLVLVILIMRQ